MRLVVVGAGIVGACVALAAVDAGIEVTVVDSRQIGGGTTSRGEGNVLVSDKPPGPELDLAVVSVATWGRLAERIGADRLEYQPKGGLIVVPDAPGGMVPEALTALADGQRAAGVDAQMVTDAHRLEPYLAPDIRGGVWYPEDAQVQPVMAAAAILGEARRLGVRYLPHTQVRRGRTSGGRLVGVDTSSGPLDADAVVNCAGTWGGDVSARLGGPLPILPRRGFILVTEPLPVRVTHKVYSADYVANVAASTEGLETSCVVESTQGGTMLIGASRERVGFDATMAPRTVARLARQALRLYPFLADVHLMRVYRGFRPYCPDHLPVIGPDPRVPGLFHACGHEGAGIGLAPATGDLIAAHLLGQDPRQQVGIDPTPYLPDRFCTDTPSPAPTSPGPEVHR